MPAKIRNPRKQFQFSILIPGLNPFLAQEVTSPDVEFEIAEHGDTNFDVKTAGRKKISNATISKISPADSLDEFIWAWKNQIQNTRTGGGDLPSNYKRNVIIMQLGTDGISVLKAWELSGCFPAKVNGMNFTRRGSENTVESFELSVDEENS